MSARFLPPDETGSKEGNIYMYIDNSNLWIQGRKTFAEKNNMAVPDDPRWRFDAGALRDILFEHCFYRPDGDQFRAFVSLYGSTPPPVDTVWHAMKSCKINVKTFKRNPYSGREKKVDAEIIADAVDDASESYHSYTPSEFVIVSGDSDIQRAVPKIIKRGFPVHVWSWKNCLANEYGGAPTLVYVHLLDPYLDRIGFLNKKWRGDKKYIPHHSAVVLDPASKASEIDKFVSSYRHQYPFCRYDLDEIRPGASSEDLVIIHARAQELSYDTREHVFQTCKRELSKHGLTVLTYHEYSQHYPHSKAKLAISSRFPEVPDEDDTSADGEGHDTGESKKEDIEDSTTSFKDVDYGIAKRKERAKQAEIKSQKRCDYRRHCSKGIYCSFDHTEEERRHFEERGPGKARKIKLCQYIYYKDGCTKGAACGFAHAESELFCPTCDKTGAHNMRDCPESPRNANRKFQY